MSNTNLNPQTNENITDNAKLSRETAKYSTLHSKYYLFPQLLPFTPRLVLIVLLILLAIPIQLFTPVYEKGLWVMTFQAVSLQPISLSIGAILMLLSVLFAQHKATISNGSKNSWDKLKKKKYQWLTVNQSFIEKVYAESQTFQKLITTAKRQQTLAKILTGGFIALIVSSIFLDLIPLDILYVLNYYPNITLAILIDATILSLGFAYALHIAPDLKEYIPPATASKKIPIFSDLISNFETYKNFTTTDSTNTTTHNQIITTIQPIWQAKTIKIGQQLYANDFRLLFTSPVIEDWCHGIQAQLTFNVGKPYCYFIVLLKKKYAKKPLINATLNKITIPRNFILKIERASEGVVPIVIRMRTSTVIYSTTPETNIELLSTCISFLKHYHMHLQEQEEEPKYENAQKKN